MSVRPVSRPPAPFTVPEGGDLDQRLAAIATELNRKANAGLAGPAYHFIGLISPDGSTWRITVSDTGTILTQQVPRI
jgi:hypothetical protein